MELDLGPWYWAEEVSVDKVACSILTTFLHLKKEGEEDLCFPLHMDP